MNGDRESLERLVGTLNIASLHDQTGNRDRRAPGTLTNQSHRSGGGSVSDETRLITLVTVTWGGGGVRMPCIKACDVSRGQMVQQVQN